MFFDHLTQYFTSKLSYERCLSDPCLLKSSNKDRGRIICGIYVDDILMCGDENSIKNDISIIEEEFEITVEENFNDYVGCEVIKKDGYIFIHQRKLIDKLLEYFKSEIKNKEKETPMGIHEHTLIPEENEYPTLLKRYQHGVGSLLYLVKLSIPDLNNCVRELSKFMKK